MSQSPAKRNGFTLVEMTLALTILSIISLAIFSLLLAAFNTDRFARNESDATTGAETSMHRIMDNAKAAIPSGSGGMTPTVSADANGQSRLTFVVPDIANNTTRTVKYYCTGASAPFTLMEDDPRYDVGASPNCIARNVGSFLVTLDSSTTFKIWVDLTTANSNGWPVRRHFCTNCRNF